MTDKIREAFEAILNHNYEPDVIHVHTVMQLEEVVRELEADYTKLQEENKLLRDVIADIKMLVNHTEELNMGNYNEDLVADMNNAFIAIAEALSKTGKE